MQPPPEYHSPQFTYLNPNGNPNLNPNGNPSNTDPYGAAYYAQQNSNPNLGCYQNHPNATTTNYVSELGTSKTVPEAAAQVNPICLENPAQSNVLQKKKNPVQQFWCEICNIECTSKEILEAHKQGKKHRKNLEKPNATLAPALVASEVDVSNATLAPALVASVVNVSNTPVIGPQENPNKRKSKEPEDLESKKKKIVAGGTAVDAVRTCEICNVVCNSEIVYRMHLAGQKHVKKSEARKIMENVFTR